VQWNVWLQPSTCKMQEYRRQSGADQEAWLTERRFPVLFWWFLLGSGGGAGAATRIRTSARKKSRELSVILGQRRQKDLQHFQQAERMTVKYTVVVSHWKTKSQMTSWLTNWVVFQDVVR
jgi:hypothetical protein